MNIVQNTLEIIVGSSTPDGLAPLSSDAVIIIWSLISSLAIIWGGVNLYILLSQSTSQGQGQSGSIFQLLCQSIFNVTVVFLQYNGIIASIAAIIFYLLISGGVQNFQQSNLALSYLFGFIESIAIAIIIAIGSQMGLSRIAFAASHSSAAANWTGRLASNFVSFIVCGFGLLVFCLILYFNGSQKPTNININELKSLSKSLLAYSFGVSTVAITTKISSVIYGKSTQASLALFAQLEPNIKKDNNNPIVICKAVGQNLRKVMSNALDYNMYLAISLSCGVAASGLNVIGADQNGQIVFDISGCNYYLPVIAFSFILCLALIISPIIVFGVQLNNGEEVVSFFKKQTTLILILSSGFLALASYLCLPVQFFIKQSFGTLKGPHLAYSILLISVFIVFALLLFAQFQTNKPQFVSTIIQAGKDGSGQSLLAGFEVGWIGSSLPVVVWACLTYLGQEWLGTMGVSLVGVAATFLIPTYLVANTYFGLLQNASFIAWIGGLGEGSIGNIIGISEHRKSIQVQFHSHSTSMSLTVNYALILMSMYVSQVGGLPVDSSPVYVGMIVGAIFIYSFASITLYAIQKMTPVLCYQIRQQIQQNSMIRQGGAQIDVMRSASIFTLNVILQFKYFLPFLLLPILVVGMAFGPKSSIGMITGMILVGLQLAFSNGLSSSLWNTARSDIFLGKAKDQQQQAITGESKEAQSADLSNQIGTRLKDAVGSCIHGFISFTAIANGVLTVMYSSIHSQA